MAQVSVVIPTSGRSQLAEAVDSVHGAFEVIVVNDSGHSIKTPRGAREVRTNRAGVAAARNAGIEEAAGHLLAFLDDDDLYEPDRLTVPDVALSICHRRDDEGVTLYNRWAQKSPQVGQVTIRRELCPPFDSALTRTEDVDWWITVTESLTPVIIEEVGLLYRSGAADRLTRVVPPRDQLRCILHLLRKHPAYFAAHPDAAALQWNRAYYWSLHTGHPLRAAGYKLRALTAR